MKKRKSGSKEGKGGDSPSQLIRQVLVRINMSYVIGLFCILIGLLALNFYDWPPNRDITTYATMAQELNYGKELYVDIWDFKPPAIFVAYMVSQFLASSKQLQIMLLDLFPTLVVLVVLVKSGRAAGFGNAAGVWSGLFWIALSNDLRLQMHEPNTEIFINACVTLAFLLFLRLRGGSPVLISVVIGVLFAIACLFKTVAIAIAVVMGLIYLVLPPPGCRRPSAAGQVAVMAVSGAICLAATLGYFAVTGRFQVFWEVMIDAGPNYAAYAWQDILENLARPPIAGDRISLGVAVAVAPWLVVAVLAWLDRDHRRSWVLLGAYAFSALIAVALPGNFYAHYFQLLVPPLCLGLGWLAALFAKQARGFLVIGAPALVGLCLAMVFAYEASSFRMPADMLLRGTYQELYLETQTLGRRLGDALNDDEILYQWGEESGLYWYSGKRPTASVLRWPLVSGPQAERLTQQTLRSLIAQPPDLIVVVNRILEHNESHPVFEWIRSHYALLQPNRPGERKFFTFFVHAQGSPELVRRVVGVDDASSAAE
jgi:hypothetical protein